MNSHVIWNGRLSICVYHDFLYSQQKFQLSKAQIKQHAKHDNVNEIRNKTNPNLITKFNLNKKKLFKSAIFLLDLCARVIKVICYIIRYRMYC